MMSRFHKTGLAAALLAAALLAAALALSAFDCSGGSAPSTPQVSPELFGALNNALTAREKALAAVLLAKDQLKSGDLRKIEARYAGVVGDANGWVKTISIGIRTGALDDPKTDASIKTQTDALVPEVKALMDDVQARVQVAMATRQVGTTTVSAAGIIGAAAQAAGLIMGVSNWIFNNRAAAAQLRQVQQAERDRLADEVLQCTTWPYWQAITPDYKSNCETIGPSNKPSVPTLPTGTGGQ